MVSPATAERAVAAFAGHNWSEQINCMTEALQAGAKQYLPPAFLVWDSEADSDLYLSPLDEGIFEVHFSRRQNDHDIQETIVHGIQSGQARDLIAFFFDRNYSAMEKILADTQIIPANSRIKELMQSRQAKKRRNWLYSASGNRVIGMYFLVAGLWAFLASQNFYSQSPWRWIFWGSAAVLTFILLAIAEKIKITKI